MRACLARAHSPTCQPSQREAVRVRLVRREVAGGLGACGALLMQPDEIAAWADGVRAKRNGPYQLTSSGSTPEVAIYVQETSSVQQTCWRDTQGPKRGSVR